MSSKVTTVKKKEGTIVRLSDAVMEFLSRQRRGRESIDRSLRRLLGIPNRKGVAEYSLLWALPSDLFTDKGEATGEAIRRKVQTKAERKEAPVAVIVRQ